MYLNLLHKKYEELTILTSVIQIEPVTAEVNLIIEPQAKIKVNILVSGVIICAVLLSECVINKQFHAPKHQDRLTEILDTR